MIINKLIIIINSSSNNINNQNYNLLLLKLKLMKLISFEIWFEFKWTRKTKRTLVELTVETKAIQIPRFEVFKSSRQDADEKIIYWS